tara:strand:+ start:240 stop:962 length:723 start_codon:yes stop_codon:yes gene_type:complete
LAWEHQVKDLEKFYRVLTYDVRGHGATETPLDVEVTQKTFVQDLHELLQSLKINSTAVLGYSMGAGIARNFAATFPEQVWGLVISNGGKLDTNTVDSDDETKAILDRKESIRSGGMDSVFEGWISSVYTPEFVLARPEIVEWHRNIMTSNNVEKYIHVIGAQGKSSEFPLSQINAPTLIIVGSGDEYTGPAQALEIQDALVGSDVSINIFPTRHGSPFERASEYNELILSFFKDLEQTLF